jgi:hypothetical protein
MVNCFDQAARRLSLQVIFGNCCRLVLVSIRRQLEAFKFPLEANIRLVDGISHPECDGGGGSEFPKKPSGHHQIGGVRSKAEIRSPGRITNGHAHLRTTVSGFFCTERDID